MFANVQHIYFLDVSKELWSSIGSWGLENIVSSQLKSEVFSPEKGECDHEDGV